MTPLRDKEFKCPSSQEPGIYPPFGIFFFPPVQSPGFPSAESLLRRSDDSSFHETAGRALVMLYQRVLPSTVSFFVDQYIRRPLLVTNTTDPLERRRSSSFPPFSQKAHPLSPIPLREKLFH